VARCGAGPQDWHCGRLSIEAAPILDITDHLCARVRHRSGVRSRLSFVVVDRPACCSRAAASTAAGASAAAANIGASGGSSLKYPSVDAVRAAALRRLLAAASPPVAAPAAASKGAVGRGIGIGVVQAQPQELPSTRGRVIAEGSPRLCGSLCMGDPSASSAQAHACGSEIVLPQDVGEDHDGRQAAGLLPASTGAGLNRGGAGLQPPVFAARAAGACAGGLTVPEDGDVGDEGDGEECVLLDDDDWDEEGGEPGEEEEEEKWEGEAGAGDDDLVEVSDGDEECSVAVDLLREQVLRVERAAQDVPPNLASSASGKAASTFESQDVVFVELSDADSEEEESTSSGAAGRKRWGTRPSHTTSDRAKTDAAVMREASMLQARLQAHIATSSAVGGAGSAVSAQTTDIMMSAGSHGATANVEGAAASSHNPASDSSYEPLVLNTCDNSNSDVVVCIDADEGALRGDDRPHGKLSCSIGSKRVRPGSAAEEPALGPQDDVDVPAALRVRKRPRTGE